jgi:chaperonin GroES
MAVSIDEKDLNKLVIIGDRVLIKPKNPGSRTKSGLYLPQSVHEKEKIQSGYIVKIGPGYPVPALTEPDEVWKKSNEKVQYIPLQAQEGDLAVYLQNAAFDLEFNGEKYVIVPHTSILLCVRDEGLLT